MAAPEYMYQDRTACRCAFFVGKNMDAAKDINKEMLPISKKCCPYGQHFFVDILCCFHIFLPTKKHNATLF
jgi:hypothetical protein